MSITIDTLELEILDNSTEAAQGLEKLRNILDGFKGVTKNTGLDKISKQIQSLCSAINTIKLENTAKLTALADGLSRFANIGKLNISKSTARQISAISAAIATISPDSVSRIAMLSNALTPLTVLGKPQLTSFINQLKKLPEVAKALKAANMDEFAGSIQRLALAMKPLADEMVKVSAGFSAFPARIQRFITQNEKLTQSNHRTGKSFGVFGTGISSLQTKFAAYYMVARRIAGMMGDWVKKSNDYVENMNLFTVSMGKYAGKATKYAEQVQSIMGIDMSEWIRNQGIFMQIGTGFGVIEEKAYAMSKGLTQVSYDIASYFNIGITEALEKVQSGFAGEIEPLRRLGYALDMATLQQIAYKNGITQNINTMTQAQKSQLRYTAIIEQSKNVMGDMARTLGTPANAMRILGQLITQLKRALGDMLIPLLVKIIPYVQAFVMVLTDAAKSLATLFGFELPTIDYSGLDGLTSGAEDAADGIDDTTKAAKKLKSAMLGFDELNIISEDENKKNNGTNGNGDLGIKEPKYDFLGKAKDDLGKIKKDMKAILDIASDIGLVILGWKITNSLIDWKKAINIKPANEQAQRAFAVIKKVFASGIVGMVQAVLVFKSASNILSGDGSAKDWIVGGLATALGAYAQYVIWGSGTLGIGIGVITTIIATIVAYRAVEQQKYENSDFYKTIQGFKERAEKRMELTKEVKVRLQTSYEKIEAADTQFATIKTMVDEMFRLNEIPIKTANDIALLKNYISAINDMDLNGLKISFDSSTNSIKETKEEVYKVISALEKEAKTVAMREMLVEYYKSETEITKSLHDATQDLTAAKTIQRQKQSELTEAMDKYRLMGEKMTQDGGRNLAQLSEYQIELDKAKRAYNDATGAVDDITESINAENVALSELDKKYSWIKNTMGELGVATDDVAKRMKENGYYTMCGFSDGVRENMHLVTDAMGEVIGSIDKETRTELSINSPSKVMYDNGTYVIQGLANGITENVVIVENAMNLLLNKLLLKMETFTNNCRGAMNTLLLDFANSMKSVSVTANGSVTYRNIKPVKVPAMYANGGFPSHGEMFFARENGAPEMVGSIGSRTAVANNDQIVQAVSRGVYDAVKSASASNAGSVSEVYIYLDGQQITANVEKHQRVRGADIMAGGAEFGI